MRKESELDSKIYKKNSRNGKKRKEEFDRIEKENEERKKKNDLEMEIKVNMKKH